MKVKYMWKVLTDEGRLVDPDHVFDGYHSLHINLPCPYGDEGFDSKDDAVQRMDYFEDKFNYGYVMSQKFVLVEMWSV